MLKTLDSNVKFALRVDRLFAVISKALSGHHFAVLFKSHYLANLDGLLLFNMSVLVSFYLTTRGSSAEQIVKAGKADHSGRISYVDYYKQSMCSLCHRDVQFPNAP